MVCSLATYLGFLTILAGPAGVEVAALLPLPDQHLVGQGDVGVLHLADVGELDEGPPGLLVQLVPPKEPCHEGLEAQLPKDLEQAPQWEAGGQVTEEDGASLLQAPVRVVAQDSAGGGSRPEPTLAIIPSHLHVDLNTCGCAACQAISVREDAAYLGSRMQASSSCLSSAVSELRRAAACVRVVPTRFFFRILCLSNSLSSRALHPKVRN